ncbi:MAG TPA: alkaline phosphatase D family protein [Phenylobacterium sp.]|jgi:alkaline phosphatase D|uniref:alkaline phosphatase D family protein n=1 Tax=Phenylobacterium sp. TaxID=1871053 RepID=UPI002D28D85F|nr:alkaline phosphatase D family protein [Phenylobacterium sp.]HZZ70474.1 alkaline phosphatase D family protein [Phenylobacterium sp.]
MRVDRRKALALLSLGAAAPATRALARDPVAFQHGVASGDPQSDRVILWTRITTRGSQAVAYRWTLDPLDRKGGGKHGSGVTGPDRDFTVKVDVVNLDPGRTYSFQFEALGVKSPVGRTATLPEGPTKDAVLAVCTCALYPNGLFNAYGAIARLPRVDAVVHLGDYIYEYGGPGSYGMDSPVAAERPHDPPHECVALADYRRRHAQYKTDPQLQAAHARAPWIVVWDDHETANDSWSGGAQNHQPGEGDWNVRKAAAIKAYYEWMPIREPQGGGFAINRSFDFGDLASLFMLETRLTARDHQLYPDAELPKDPTAADVAAWRKRLDDPARKMMSAGQEAWLGHGLAASVKAGRPWQVLGNEVVMARLFTPPIHKYMTPEAYAAAKAELPRAGAAKLAKIEANAALGLPWGADMWDGYPADRQRLYALSEKAHANLIVVSGDSHAFWANELWDAETGGKRVAVEFGTSAITSPSVGDALPGVPLGEAFAKYNREVLYNNQTAKGFVLLTLTHSEATAELTAVSSIKDKAFTTRPIATYHVTPGPSGISGLKTGSAALQGQAHAKA